ncbi:MAG: response regulator transcription factor [Chloroflexota bacterium]
MYVILADDDLDVRQALICLLQDECDLQLATETKNADELLRSLTGTCPDLVLLDWELPGIDGCDLLAQIHEICPTVKVIALSAYPEACEEAASAGIQWFVSKGDPPERLLAVIHSLRTTNAI